MFKNAVSSGLFINEEAIAAFVTGADDTSLSGSSLMESQTAESVFEELTLPPLQPYADHFTDSVEALLAEGKQVVPFILNFATGDVRTQLEADHGFDQKGSATGEGFTCAVYRKSINGSVPVYVITGDLAISVDEFHALACDVDFRHNWDDQFHHAASDHVENNVSIVQWVVKWPWPMAPREYNYLLSPHVLADGTKLVMATSVSPVGITARSHSHTNAVPVKEYFGITACKPLPSGGCRYCVFYFDDPSLPGKMPAWLEQYVTNQLLPSFPRKILAGAKMYPRDRLTQFAEMTTIASNSK